MPVYGRFELTKLVIKSVLNHKDILKKELNINLIVCGFEQKYKELAQVWEFDYIEHPNNPLGAKFEAVIGASALIGKPDYLMLLASDDFLTPDFFSYAIDYMEKERPWIVNESIYFIKNTDQCRKVTCNSEIGAYVGSGVIVRTDVYINTVKEFGSMYETSLNKGLDGSAFARIKSVAGKPAVMPKINMVGVKTAENIWPFEMFQNFQMVDWFNIQMILLKNDARSLETFKFERYESITN